MLTWVIVKARIDSSLNLYKHCVACADENNYSNPTGPFTPHTLYTAFRGVKTPRKAVYSHTLSPKMASGSAHGTFLQAQMCPKKAKQALFGVFWGYFGCTPEKGPF